MVWLVRDGRLERRAVTVAHESGDTATIAAGLGGGERLVVEGPEQLTEGLAVKEAKK